MSVARCDLVEDEFTSSADIYGFSKPGITSNRLPSRPTFDLPVDTSSTENPAEIGDFKCNCRYLWLRELHGVSAVMMSNSLEEKILWVSVIITCALFSILNARVILGGYNESRSTTKITIIPVRQIQYPTLVFCPKNADALDYDGLHGDLSERIGTVDNSTVDDLFRYAIAGSGFDNIDVSTWSEEYKSELGRLYTAWRGNRTLLQMFYFIFSENGYRCANFFDTCWAGSRVLDCCSVFEPTYVMLRGRCFRLIDGYNQTDVDETDKLSIRFKNVQGALSGKKNKPQVVMYLGDSHPEVGMYPRMYLNYRDWNRIRFFQRRLSMLPENPRCSLKPLNQGKSTCFVSSWIQNIIVAPLNCTLAYFKEMLPYLNKIPVCDPSVIVNDYARVISLDLPNFNCLPACERVENTMQMATSPDFGTNMNYSFSIEASFSELEYEHYSEIRLTTAAGFISELGGQSGLFVGCSVMTFVQLILSTVLFCTAYFLKTYRKHFAIPLTVKSR